MKKSLKIIAILLLVILAALVALLIYLSKQPSTATDYQKTVQTCGEIEAKYMASGSHGFSTYEQTALQGFGKYTICYADRPSFYRLTIYMG